MTPDGYMVTNAHVVHTDENPLYLQFAMTALEEYAIADAAHHGTDAARHGTNAVHHGTDAARHGTNAAPRVRRAAQNT